jgi:hypothetical protein
MEVIGYKRGELDESTTRAFASLLQFWDDPNMDIGHKLAISLNRMRGENGDYLRAFSRTRLPRIQAQRWLEF